MKKTVLRAVCFTFAATVCLSGCSSAHRGEEPAGELWNPPEILARQPERPFDIEVDEETFQLSLRVDDETIPISDGSVSRAAEDYMEEGNTVSWRYPDEQIRVKLATEQDYLSVEITSERTGDHTFTWPYISAEQYYLPLGEGKRIPAGDPDWIRYLEQQQAAVMEQFSMPFWISSDGEHCVMFIMENPYRTQLSFFAKPALGFSVSHEYPEIGGGRTNRFRIYLTEKDPVELATISFGQSFQITPIQLAATVSSLINGGTRVTPHFGVEIRDGEGNLLRKLSYEQREGVVSAETSETMRYLLEKVVSEGGGKKAYIEGYRIGGKTATSQTLPRGTNKYISSFVGFAPADNPQVLAMAIIHNPQGIYYGGTIAAPVVQDIFSNILPYLGIEKEDVVMETKDNPSAVE